MRYVALPLLLFALSIAQTRPTPSPDEKAISDKISSLRKVPDDQRGAVTRDLSQRIRKRPPTVMKQSLAGGLANLATEGDFGASTLQEVAATLADALREQPQRGSRLYEQLAQLVRYENVKVTLDAAPFAEALKKLDALEQRRAAADFTLHDLGGKEWKLSALRGKVVLVNFWATWCPPCRKEMPDLATLHSEFGPRGLVILAISDEELAKVEPFIKQYSYSFPILLDPGRTVHTLFGVDGIPKSFVYDRDGKLVGTAIDMRTKGQFLAMLSKAGLR
ncbi:MAG TPA: TlpA disulfide reductase family protein [Bryobacteraceae bacterium]|nr:TlpA disulfide reductase family protein [Bryobacteraceae bacterium]